MRLIGWLLPLLILTVLAAQDVPKTTDDGTLKPYAKSIEEHLKGLNKELEHAPEITVRPEPPRGVVYAEATRPCSIPLLSVAPKAKGSMPVLPGPTDTGPIRTIEPPAPPCDSNMALRPPVGPGTPFPIVLRRIPKKP